MGAWAPRLVLKPAGANKSLPHALLAYALFHMVVASHKLHEHEGCARQCNHQASKLQNKFSAQVGACASRLVHMPTGTPFAEPRWGLWLKQCHVLAILQRMAQFYQAQARRSRYIALGWNLRAATQSWPQNVNAAEADLREALAITREAERSRLSW